MSGPPRWDRTVRTIAAVAVLASPTLRIAIDAGEPTGPAHVEASHDADRCRVLHDHAACLQLFASSVVPPEPVATAPAVDGPEPPAVSPERPVRSPEVIGLRFSRAPPALPV